MQVSLFSIDGTFELIEELGLLLLSKLESVDVDDLHDELSGIVLEAIIKKQIEIV